MPAIAVDQPEIIVVASLLPQEESESAATVSVIDAVRLERLGEPLAVNLLRQVPSVAVATSGPAGTLSEVRIRGAETRHTLLFIDGIRANDPAAANAPRFELLNADLVSRIEVVRGPQSALWGSEAIGGVVAVNGLVPTGQSLSGTAEAGSNGFRRAAASAAAGSATARLALGAATQRSDGIDSFDGSGDRDGYRNLAVRALGELQPAGGVTLGAAAFLVDARSEFDGSLFFRRADTRDTTDNRLAAGRLWAELGSAEDDGWSGRVSASLLGSSNTNRLAGAFLNQTRGRRRVTAGQLQHRLSAGATEHGLVIAAEAQAETFRRIDLDSSFADANQRRDRAQQALTAQWHARWGDWLITDLAVRRDRFNRFKDATTVRAAALARLSGRIDATLSFGQGIAQPSFFDLYGFYPDLFVGNPGLRPERSRSLEGRLRYRSSRFAGSLALYRQSLTDEFLTVDVDPDPFIFIASTVNGSGRSRRKGIEAEAQWTPVDWLRLSAHYAYGKASQPSGPAGAQVREQRRPRHSGAMTVDGRRGRLTLGASISYTGERSDTDFDSFTLVRLRPYWLAGARVAYAITPQVEAYVRVANAFASRYSDVVGYRTEGRTAYGGIRLALGR